MESVGPIATNSDSSVTPSSNVELVLSRELGQLRRELEALTQVMHQSFEESEQTSGSPRLVRDLRKQGFRTSKTRVRRLMKSAGLCPLQKRRIRVKTTQSNPHLPVAHHLLQDAPTAQQAGQRFYSDITYIPTKQGWLFTAAAIFEGGFTGR